ncbi:MAG: hypothetical protein KAY24_12560 [Candidatus Eisenbacteria sp.]|nr:hypothetical protein [Candidatus Eisenbacteria bacterium]
MTYEFPASVPAELDSDPVTAAGDGPSRGPGSGSLPLQEFVGDMSLLASLHFVVMSGTDEETCSA